MAAVERGYVVSQCTSGRHGFSPGGDSGTRTLQEAHTDGQNLGILAMKPCPSLASWGPGLVFKTMDAKALL